MALCLFASSAGAAIPENYTVELHSHPFMEHGMGPFFRGEFNGELKAEDWTNQMRSMINPEALDRSGIGVFVATLYALPYFSGGLRDSIRAQLNEADRFVANYPNWVIARDADQARLAMMNGKRVVILALEGAGGILENEEDLAEFIDRRGIRIVTPMHLADDKLGGAAFIGGWGNFLVPFALFKSLINPRYDELGVRLNPRGLTSRGREFVDALIRRKVWIDLTHASDATQDAIIPILREKGLPLLYTHTGLRKFTKVERGISDNQLKQVQASEGIVGVMPSEKFLEGTKVNERHCPQVCVGKCDGGITALATQYSEVASLLGADSVMIGSDFNGGVPHIEPDCPTGTGIDGERGLWNIGQTPEVWKALRVLNAPVPQPLSRMVERFLDTWARVSK